MTPQEVLEIKFKSRDLGKTLTIREFLVQLLETLWEEEEGFSGKRPFGNSGWQGDVERALVRAGAVPGRLDEYGDLDGVDPLNVAETMISAIRALGVTP